MPGKTDSREAIVEEQQAETEVDWEEQPYVVVDGKVDSGTYNGYRRYHSYCHVCHGPDGLGSSYAPALIEFDPGDRLRGLSRGGDLRHRERRASPSSR